MKVLDILKSLVEALERRNKQELIEGPPYKDEDSVNRHLKHLDEIDPNLTVDEFNTYGDYLYTTPVDNKNVFGFISCNKGVYGVAKYDKRNRLFIVYDFDENGNPFTRTTMRFGKGRYEDEKRKYYAGEVPKGT